MEVIYTADDRWPTGKFYVLFDGVQIELNKAGLRRSMHEAGVTHVRFVYRVDGPLDAGYYILRGWGKQPRCIHCGTPSDKALRSCIEETPDGDEMFRHDHTWDDEVTA